MFYIKVVVAGRYLDTNNKARHYSEGENLVTNDWYAKALLSDGLVREYTPRKANKEAKRNEPEPVQPAKRKRKPKSPNVTEQNPFAEVDG